MNKISAILLAGGSGSRMNSPIPKQYLKIRGKTIARYSFDVLVQCPDIHEIVVVCEPHYRDLFKISVKNFQENMWMYLKNL